MIIKPKRLVESTCLYVSQYQYHLLLCKCLTHNHILLYQYSKRQDTDLPFDVALPAQGFAGEDENEEIRELVLGWSVSSSVAQRMEERPCENCGKNIYGAALSCRHCGFQNAPCVVTGQPVLRASRVDCSNCKSQANRDDWNVYINKFGSCPWCRARQKISTSFVLGA